MAADKEIMKQLKEAEAETPRAVADVLIQHLDLGLGNLPAEQAEATEAVHREALAESFAQFAFQLRAQAGLWGRSGAKGAKGFAAEVSTVAQYAESLARGITALLSAPPTAAPGLPVQWCGDQADHGPHAYAHADGNIGNVQCDGNHPRDLSGLDALIADATRPANKQCPAADLGHDHPGPHAWICGPGKTEATCGGYPAPQPVTIAAEHRTESVVDTAAYPRGEVDDIPTTPPRGETFPGALTDAELDSLGIVQRLATESTPAQIVHAAREIGATLPTSQLPPAPTLGQAGTNPGAYDHAYVPPGGRRLTFAELMVPVPAAALPQHLSHSQIGDTGECSVKYRAQRIESLPQVPQWANVGGSTLHAAIEDIERHEITEPGTVVGRVDTERAWQHHFLAEIERVARDTGIPETRWRSSRKGAENRTFWEVQGPLMLARYLAARHPDEPTAMLTDGAPFGPSVAPIPAIEYSIMPSVPTPYGPMPFKAEIDRVTTLVDDGGLSFVIKDYKSSYERPTDPTQLGRYAWALRLAGVMPQHARILGQYFDARRGEWTAPVDLAEAYPWDLFVYDVAAAHGEKLSLATRPTPAHKSPFCGGCAVRYACPIMAPAQR